MNRRTIIIPILLLTALICSCSRGPARPTTTNKTAQRIYDKAIPRYANLRNTAWPAIYAQHSLPLKQATHDVSIPMIRQRLIKLGDLNKANGVMV